MIVNKIVKKMVKRKLEITGATLLSTEEVEKYLSPEDTQYNSCWWLRSPGDRFYTAAFVYSGGGIDFRGYDVNFGRACVRPALKIKNLESSGMFVGDIFVVLGCRFKIISENLAWMDKQDIGMGVFNENKYDNDYETSDIKNQIDEWYNRLLCDDSEDEIDEAGAFWEETWEVS